LSTTTSASSSYRNAIGGGAADIAVSSRESARPPPWNAVCSGWVGEVQMVHLLGQGLGARDSGLGKSRITLAASLVILLVTGAVAPAAAQQAIGFHGGAAVDPEQVFGGVFWQSGDVFGGLRIRPGVDGATGEGFRIATINVDFVYGLPLGASGWTLVTGGGPSVVVTRIPDLDFKDTGVGAHYLFGFGHDSGFFTEIRLGSGNAQSLKLGVGWAIALD
jgi:hypothetical protein